MASFNVRISDKAYRALRDLSRKEGTSMQRLLDEAVEQLRRKKFLTEANAAFAALKANPRGWKQELAERKLWERALADGAEKS